MAKKKDDPLSDLRLEVERAKLEEELLRIKQSIDDRLSRSPRTAKDETAAAKAQRDLLQLEKEIRDLGNPPELVRQIEETKQRIELNRLQGELDAQTKAAAVPPESPESKTLRDFLAKETVPEDLSLRLTKVDNAAERQFLESQFQELRNVKANAAVAAVESKTGLPLTDPASPDAFSLEPMAEAIRAHVTRTGQEPTKIQVERLANAVKLVESSGSSVRNIRSGMAGIRGGAGGIEQRFQDLQRLAAQEALAGEKTAALTEIERLPRRAGRLPSRLGGIGAGIAGLILLPQITRLIMGDEQPGNPMVDLQMARALEEHQRQALLDKSLLDTRQMNNDLKQVQIAKALLELQGLQRVGGGVI